MPNAVGVPTHRDLIFLNQYPLLNKAPLRNILARLPEKQMMNGLSFRARLSMTIFSMGNCKQVLGHSFGGVQKHRVGFLDRSPLSLQHVKNARDFNAMKKAKGTV